MRPLAWPFGCLFVWLFLLPVFLITHAVASNSDEDRFRKVSESLDRENAKLALEYSLHSEDLNEDNGEVMEGTLNSFGTSALITGTTMGIIGNATTTYSFADQISWAFTKQDRILFTLGTVAFTGMTLYLAATLGEAGSLWDLPEFESKSLAGGLSTVGAVANGVTAFLAYALWSTTGKHDLQSATSAFGNTAATAIFGYLAVKNFSSANTPAGKKTASLKVNELLSPGRAKRLWVDKLAHLLGFEKNAGKVARVNERFEELDQQGKQFDPFLEISDIVGEDGEPIISEELAVRASSLSNNAAESFIQIREKLPETYSQKQRAEASLALVQRNIAELKRLYEENPSEALTKAIRRGEQIEAKAQLRMI